jgi:hypothetical protein
MDKSTEKLMNLCKKLPSHSLPETMKLTFLQVSRMSEGDIGNHLQFFQFELRTSFFYVKQRFLFFK